MASYVPAYTVSLVREGSVKMAERPVFHTAEDAARLFDAAIPDDGVEHFGIALLDARHRLIGYNEVSRGGLSTAVVHPREVFTTAILSKAAALILTHNHPSGDPEPSDEDVALTRRLKSSGDVLGIEVLDHVIVGKGSSRFVSFLQRGLL